MLFYQGAVAVSRISQGVTSSIAEACNCSYSVANIVDGSVLLQCRDSISAEVSLEIKPVKVHSVNQLICQFHNLLIQHKNVIDLGKFLPKCTFSISSWKQDRKNWCPVKLREPLAIPEGNHDNPVSGRSPGSLNWGLFFW